jgi:hypothetical protein
MPAVAFIGMMLKKNLLIFFYICTEIKADDDRGCKSGCNMSMVGAYFVGFVTPTSKDSGQYWNDEIREVRLTA